MILEISFVKVLEGFIIFLVFIRSIETNFDPSNLQT